MDFTCLGHNFNINRGILPIKVVVFTLNLGMKMVFPYLSLQMRSLGMSLADIGLVNGLAPFIIFMLNPIAGFFADKLGNKPVIFVYLLIIIVSQSSFDLTPRTKTTTRLPTAMLVSQPEPESQYILNSIKWPLCNVSATLDRCKDTAKALDNLDVSSFIECQDRNLVSVAKKSIDLNFVQVVDGGDYCQAITNTGMEIFNASQPLIECRIANFTQFDTCTNTKGSHALTFWVYFAIRSVFISSINVVYPLVDTVIFQMVNMYHSSFSDVFILHEIATVITPALSGLLIQDAKEGSGEETNYNVAFYVADCFMMITLVIVPFLKVKQEKTKTSILKAWCRLATNRAALFLFAINVISGMQWGVKDSYLFIYMSEDLGASSAMLGTLVSIEGFSGLVFVLLSKRLINHIGQINAIVLGFLIEAGRNMVYSTVNMSPPYYAYFLSSLNGFYTALPWIAKTTFTYNIAPSDLSSSMLTIMGCIEFILAKGLGSYLGGLIVGDQSRVTIGELLQMVSGCLFVSSLVILAVYYTVGKKWEAEAVRLKNIEKEDVKTKEEEEGIQQDQV